MPAFGLCRKQDGNDPGARSKVKAGFPLLHLGKTGEQDGIHSKAEQLSVLDDLKPVPVQVIQTFSLF